MSCCRVKSILLGLLVLGIACMLAYPLSSEEPKPARPPERDRIEQRIKEIQPTAKERRFDAIGSQRVDLVLHQRDQRRDDNGQTVLDQRRYLVTQ